MNGAEFSGPGDVFGLEAPGGGEAEGDAGGVEGIVDREADFARDARAGARGVLVHPEHGVKVDGLGAEVAQENHGVFGF